jgi:hypothetical protein
MNDLTSKSVVRCGKPPDLGESWQFQPRLKVTFSFSQHTAESNFSQFNSARPRINQPEVAPYLLTYKGGPKS